MFLQNIHFLQKKLFLYGKKVENEKKFLLKKTFFTEKNYISFQKYIFTQKIFVLQIKYEYIFIQQKKNLDQFLLKLHWELNNLVFKVSEATNLWYSLN